MFSFDIPNELIWIVVLSFIVSFVLAFGIGANDVANSFGTSVGSNSLTLQQACILATIFETLGAVLVGAKVSDTIRKGVIDINVYRNSTVNGSDEYKLLMVGQMASLTGSCIWLLIATFFRIPVSGTHSIIGATVGFALVAKGFRGINWIKLISIVSSWFISPVLSAVVSVSFFFLFERLVLSKKDHLEPGLRILPIIYSFAIIVNAFSVFWKGPEMLKFNLIPLWGVFILSFGLGNIICVLMKIFYVPFERKRIIASVKEVYEKDLTVLKATMEAEKTNDISNAIIEEEQIDEENSVGESKQKLNSKRDLIRDSPEQAKIFAGLQVLTAIFGAFAHGGNDVSNAIAPLIGVWECATKMSVVSKVNTNVPILIYGSLGIVVGLWVWGRGVIQTLGQDLTRITPSSGVCIELGSALTVLIASNMGIPISTTHCKVGSVVGVGRYRSKDNVDWSIFRNIIIAWGVTLPISAFFSALLMFGLKFAV